MLAGMGSATLVAAASYSDKVTQISCKGQRSTKNFSLLKKKCSVIYRELFMTGRKTPSYLILSYTDTAGAFSLGDQCFVAGIPMWRLA